MSEQKRPTAFYHQDGLVPAWNFASRYAGKSGHIATLPEIVQLRFGIESRTSDSPWKSGYTSSSAEYVGVGADGQIKIIVAHGVGPMSTIDGIKAAYKWEWGDKSRRRRGGRITAQQFLDLEAGVYGKVKVIRLAKIYEFGGDVAQVNVLDFQDYLGYAAVFDGDLAFGRYLTVIEALVDPLLRMRLGSDAYRYLMKHEAIAQEWHSKERPNDQYEWSRGLDDRVHPFITEVRAASNCPYMLPDQAVFKATREHVWQPRVPEPGYALAHLLNIDPLTWTITSERNIGSVLCASPGVHEWRNNAKFVAVPEGGTLDSGIADGPDPSKLIHEHWQHFLQPVDDGYTPITPFNIEQVSGEWFTHYPKQCPDGYCMDERDLEFHVRSVECVGDKGAFKVDEDFFLRYTLEQVREIMPRGANAYEIVDVSVKDSNGLTTVTVRFYVADVDTSCRLPRTDEIARDYERLMEVYAQ